MDADAALMHYLLFYEAGPDYEERRQAVSCCASGARAAAVARGEIVLGGAYANPVDGAVILFRSDSPAAAEEFAKAILTW